MGLSFLTYKMVIKEPVWQSSFKVRKCKELYMVSGKSRHSPGTQLSSVSPHDHEGSALSSIL